MLVRTRIGVQIAPQHADYPAEIERSILVGGHPAEVGPPLLDLGATILITIVRGPEYDLTELAEWIAWRDAL